MKKKNAIKKLNGSQIKSFVYQKGRKIVGKGENPGNHYFLLFPQCFQPYQRQKTSLLSTFILSSADALNLDLPKILLFGKDLKLMPVWSRINR